MQKHRLTTNEWEWFKIYREYGNRGGFIDKIEWISKAIEYGLAQHSCKQEDRNNGQTINWTVKVKVRGREA